MNETTLSSANVAICFFFTRSGEKLLRFENTALEFLEELVQIWGRKDGKPFNPVKDIYEVTAKLTSSFVSCRGQRKGAKSPPEPSPHRNNLQKLHKRATNKENWKWKSCLLLPPTKQNVFFLAQFFGQDFNKEECSENLGIQQDLARNVGAIGDVQVSENSCPSASSRQNNVCVSAKEDCQRERLHLKKKPPGFLKNVGRTEQKKI